MKRKFFFCYFAIFSATFCYFLQAATGVAVAEQKSFFASISASIFLLAAIPIHNYLFIHYPENLAILYLRKPPRTFEPKSAQKIQTFGLAKKNGVLIGKKCTVMFLIDIISWFYNQLLFHLNYRLGFFVSV